MNSTKRIIYAAMLAALTFIATIVIKIPSPLNGYLNLGDALVLLTGCLLSPTLAFLASGIGSAMADAVSGFFIYIPATFIIKGVMSLIVSLIIKRSKERKLLSKIIGGVLAEILMIIGYYTFEGFLYGFGASMINIFPNALQGILGFIIGMMLVRLFDKYRIKD